MNKLVLPSAHRRSLSAVARNIENSLNDMARKLKGNSSDSFLSRVEESYTETERQYILSAIENVRQALVELIRHFSLDISSVSEEQILQAHISHIWTLLQDSYSKKSKGYGTLPKEFHVPLDEAIGKLLERVEYLQLSARKQTGTNNGEDVN